MDILFALLKLSPPSLSVISHQPTLTGRYQGIAPTGYLYHHLLTLRYITAIKIMSLSNLSLELTSSRWRSGYGVLPITVRSRWSMARLYSRLLWLIRDIAFHLLLTGLIPRLNELPRRNMYMMKWLGLFGVVRSCLIWFALWWWVSCTQREVSHTALPGIGLLQSPH